MKTNIKKKNILAKIVIGIFAILIVCSFTTKKVEAAYPVTVVAEASPTAIQRTIDTTMQRLKSFVLDKMATMIAKQILHQMTVSVINWINSGFEGSPAFITNPKGFFLDVGDQVTGAFLADGGPLSALCSPFSLDIRLSLALQTSGFIDKRYTCTLGTIINNGKNAVENASVNGFLAGDFQQGGWPAFIAVNTQPQNNAVGAYLRAENDLYTKITGKQALIKADLQMGRGFASWSKCTDVTDAVVNADMVEGMSYNDMGKLYEMKSQKINVGTTRYGESVDVESTLKKDGSLSYKKCETQTPGSVIADTLQKQLNVPAEELELANDINAVVNALVTQLISQMLGGGLRALSGSSGSQPSYTSQIIQESVSPKSSAMQDARSSLDNEMQSSLKLLTDYRDKFKQAEALITDSKNRLLTSRTCFTDKLASNDSQVTYYRSTIERQIASIDGEVTNIVNHLLISIQSKMSVVNQKISDLELIRTTQSSSLSDMQKASANYSNFVQSGAYVRIVNSDEADTELENARTQSSAFNKDAAQFLNQCSGNYYN
jgi:flagellar motility protein MotE (MotC chaperone)